MSQAVKATRAQAYGLLLSGTMTGLPIPSSINMFDHGSLQLVLDKDDQAAVDRWAAHLGLPTPKLDTTIFSRGTARPWVAYQSRVDRHPGLPGWSVEVYCTVRVTTNQRPAEVAGGAR